MTANKKGARKKQEKQQNTEQIGRIPTWLGIVIIIAALVIALLIIAGSKHPASQQAQPKNQNPNTTVEEIKEVFSYVGKISKISQDKIEFNALAVKNPGLEKDAAITALVSEQTKFIKVTVPKVSPEEIQAGEAGSVFKREEISLSDLNTGDEITAISAENIKGKTEFTAKKIEVIEQ